MPEPSLAFEQEVTLDGEQCALWFLRSASQIARRVCFDETGILFVRGATILTLTRARGQGAPLALGVGEVVVVPRKATVTFTSQSSTAEVLVVRPHAALIEKVAAAYKVPLDRMQSVLDTWHLLERRRWFDEVHHRYFFERVMCKKKDNIATAFLEMELVKEAYFSAAEKSAAKEEKTCAPPFGEADSLGARALRFVEAHLFEPLSLDVTARELGTSRATLVRHFREMTGRAPGEYVRDRRLDEAHTLLEKNATSVADVAFAVGYENVGAFTQAFRRRFKRNPSSKRAAGER